VTLGGALAPIAGGALRDWSGGFGLTGWFVVGMLVIGALLLVRAVLAADASRSPSS
jgi:hypothetical protein